MDKLSETEMLRIVLEHASSDCVLMADLVSDGTWSPSDGASKLQHMLAGYQLTGLAELVDKLIYQHHPDSLADYQSIQQRVLAELDQWSADIA